MKLNNKGFAITGILYTVLILFLLLLSSFLAIILEFLFFFFFFLLLLLLYGNHLRSEGCGREPEEGWRLHPRHSPR